ncbi:hypothetical protein IQ06DRAFT_64427 [Phaeosphaeriaceae sp. SRC1lsM3a]|nr:hypothetical protein IQ06DRAFT_64427 [Stagonospora sp. SRC1lsM3a]
MSRQVRSGSLSYLYLPVQQVEACSVGVNAVCQIICSALLLRCQIIPQVKSLVKCLLETNFPILLRVVSNMLAHMSCQMPLGV